MGRIGFQLQNEYVIGIKVQHRNRVNSIVIALYGEMVALLEVSVT